MQVVVLEEFEESLTAQDVDRPESEPIEHIVSVGSTVAEINGGARP